LKIKHYMALLGITLLSLGLGVAHAADQAPPHPTKAQMEAVKACAAAKGVELPAPPAGAPPKGERPAEGQKPPKDGEGKGPHGPKLTDAQRAIVDACFKEQGIEPPHGGPHDGKGSRPERSQEPTASE